MFCDLIFVKLAVEKEVQYRTSNNDLYTVYYLSCYTPFHLITIYIDFSDNHKNIPIRPRIVIIIRMTLMIQEKNHLFFLYFKFSFLESIINMHKSFFQWMISFVDRRSFIEILLSLVKNEGVVCQDNFLIASPITKVDNEWGTTLIIRCIWSNDFFLFH